MPNPFDPEVERVDLATSTADAMAGAAQEYAEAVGRWAADPTPDSASAKLSAQARLVSARTVAEGGAVQGGRRLIGDTMGASLDRLHRRHTQEERPIPVPWANVARELGGGLWPGAHVLVGNTGSGKTQFALSIADHAAGHGIPTCYVGLELDREGHDARIAALHTGRKWSRLYYGTDTLTDVERSTVDKAITGRPYWTELGTAHGWDRLEQLAQEMRAEVPEEKKGQRPILIVLDYLQLMGGDDRELRGRIGKAATVARAIAGEYSAAVLMLSSTARNNYGALDTDAGAMADDTDKDTKRKRAKPLQPGDPPFALVGLGKESGEVEYSADSVMVLGKWKANFRPDVGGELLHVAFAKMRALPEGATRWAALRFNGSRFEVDGSDGSDAPADAAPEEPFPC